MVQILLINSDFIQESICLINECYNNVEISSEQCVLPCKGLYADISLENSGITKVEDMKKFDPLIKSYENYKRGFTKDIEYPPALKGRVEFQFDNNSNFKTSLDFKKKQKLHLVQISFATPSFDRIIKDEKANMGTKLSTIGGTMGLLTGFSIISGVEIIYFVLKMFFSLVRKCFEQRISNLN